MDSNADRVSAVPIIFFLSIFSEKKETSNKQSASVPVAKDNVRLAIAGETPNCFAKTGMTGWVLYRFANVTKLPRNKAKIVFLNDLPAGSI